MKKIFNLIILCSLLMGDSLEDKLKMEKHFFFWNNRETEKCFLKILEHDSQNIASHWES